MRTKLQEEQREETEAKIRRLFWMVGGEPFLPGDLSEDMAKELGYKNRASLLAGLKRLAEESRFFCRPGVATNKRRRNPQGHVLRFVWLPEFAQEQHRIAQSDAQKFYVCMSTNSTQLASARNLQNDCTSVQIGEKSYLRLRAGAPKLNGQIFSAL